MEALADRFGIALIVNMDTSVWSLADVFGLPGIGARMEPFVEVVKAPAGAGVEGERDAKSFVFVCNLLGVAGGGIVTAPSSGHGESSRT